MLFSLDVIRARKGDCMLLHYGSKDDPRLMVIDGGPKKVYTPHLRPRLQAIREARGLDENTRLTVDLLMVSHVDDDHIQGILDLTRELINDNNPRFVNILSFWHNSFENVIGDQPEQLLASFQTKFGAASMNGEPSELTIETEKDEELVISVLKILASIKQGAQLRSDVVKRLGAELNPDFGGKLIMAEAGSGALDMGDELELTVVGPMLAELQELHEEHQKWLKNLQEKGLTAEDALSAYVDESPANLSSLVVLAAVQGKSILFTGDARGDKVLEGLELVGLIGVGGKIHVDILKVPHHGSARNVKLDFFERITAKHYVFSGNGEHGNPDRETLEMLRDARGNTGYTIHLTYPIDEVDVGRKHDWEKEQTKERNRGKAGREDWSPEKHSLRAMFDADPPFAATVSVVEDGEPHVIDLLDDLGV